MTDSGKSDLRNRDPGGAGDTQQAILDFLQACADEMAALATDPPAADGAKALSQALAQSTPLAFEPCWLPALDSIDLVDDTPLARAFASLARSLPWTPTMRATDGGVDFALAPLDTVRQLGDLTVGIMYVRPGQQYPLHHHSPQELYLTLSGQARWRYGGHDDFRPLGPGATVYNHPDDLHSSIASDTPLVALYVLWN